TRSAPAPTVSSRRWHANRGGRRDRQTVPSRTRIAWHFLDTKESINRPYTRRGQLQEMAVRVAKVQAAATPRPVRDLLNDHAVGAQPFFPGGQIRGGDGKGEVHGARAVVRRGVRQRAAPLEEQQQLPACHVQRPDAVVADEHFQLEERLVELRGAVEIVHVEGGFQDASQLGHGRLFLTAGSPVPSARVRGYPVSSGEGSPPVPALPRRLAPSYSARSAGRARWGSGCDGAPAGSGRGTRHDAAAG